MKNLSQMMKQAQEMQAKMAQMQDSLGSLEVEGKSGGGMVVATMTGKSELKRLKIDPSLVDPSDVEVLEDLVVAAVNDAKSRVEEQVAAKTQDMMSGMSLPPGFKLPF